MLRGEMAKSKELTEAQITKKLIESSVKIQSKTVDIISAMEKLTKRVDKMVSLFEEASKHVTEAETAEERVNELTTKLEGLLEQNKAIARGLILLEKYVRGKSELEKEAPKTEEYTGL